MQSSIHIIITMRSKTETVQEGGKVRKVGMKDEQREGAEYELTLKFELDHGSHLANATKDRTRLFRDPIEITPAVGEKLLQWLETGEVSALTEEQIAAHLTALDSAKTIADLRAAFNAAVDAARKVEDRNAISRFTERKDADKARVTA